MCAALQASLQDHCQLESRESDRVSVGSAFWIHLRCVRFHVFVFECLKQCLCVVLTIRYIGDVVEPSHRPKFMGFVGFAVSMGLVAGPAVGGALSQKELYFYVCSLYENCCEPGTAACYPNTTDFDLSLGMF